MCSFGEERDPYQVHLDQVADRYILTKGFQLIRDELMLGDDSQWCLTPFFSSPGRFQSQPFDLSSMLGRLDFAIRHHHVHLLRCG